jgi:hypothetical protein
VDHHALELPSPTLQLLIRSQGFHDADMFRRGRVEGGDAEGGPFLHHSGHPFEQRLLVASCGPIGPVQAVRTTLEDHPRESSLRIALKPLGKVRCIQHPCGTQRGSVGAMSMVTEPGEQDGIGNPVEFAPLGQSFLGETVVIEVHALTHAEGEAFPPCGTGAPQPP